MKWPLLEVVPEEARRRLLSLTRRRRFQRGEIVFHEGDPGDSLHLIDRGYLVAERTTPLGDVAALRVLGPGEVFGELALIAPAPRTATVRAVEPTETLSVHRDVFEDLRVTHPAINRLLVHALTAEVRRLSARLVEALYVPSDKRIYLRLLDLAHVFATGALGGNVGIPLTQEQLAQMAGTTRSTANRVLRAAEAEGIVRLTRSKIEVVDVDALTGHSH